MILKLLMQLKYDAATCESHEYYAALLGKSDDAVRAFFVEVHELFVKYLVNPFAAVDGPIVSPLFNQHVKLLAKRILQ